MRDFFKTIPDVRYEGPKSKNPFAFKFYDPDAMVLGKPMRENLRFALSYWHTMCAGGTDPFGAPTMARKYAGATPLEQAKDKADAAFAFMEKLHVDYYCFHDVDIAPEGESLAEFKDNLAEMTAYLSQKQKQSGKKLLWGTANCFSHPRYMHGAGTSPDPDVFACAAAQIKNAIDATIKLGGQGYVFWDGREGYETLLNTDMQTELRHMAALLAMARDYARAQGYTGAFYIEPKPKEPTKHQYDFDAATVLGFLRQYDLAADFKLNIEANHATLAGHTFQHELAVARINHALGSIDANLGDPNLGWDTDRFPTDVYDAALCMLEVLRAGGFTTGGLNFDAKVRRGSYTPEDIAYGYIAAMDTFALGLRAAAALIEDGELDAFVENRYAGYRSGMGKKIDTGKTDLAELEAYALGLRNVMPTSGRQEYLEGIVNRILFGNL